MERTKILITGATGTIGKILAMHLSPWYDVYAPSRQELNLLDRLSVVDYLLEHNWFDVVIHCAVKGANDVRSTDSSIALITSECIITWLTVSTTMVNSSTLDLVVNTPRMFQIISQIRFWLKN